MISSTKKRIVDRLQVIQEYNEISFNPKITG